MFGLGAILAYFGIGGTVALVLGMVFMPQLTVRIITGAGEVIAGLASKAALKFFAGCERIFGTNSSAFALLIFMLTAGVIGDKFDPYRAVLAWEPFSSPSTYASNNDDSEYERPRQRVRKKTFASRRAPKQIFESVADTTRRALGGQ